MNSEPKLLKTNSIELIDSSTRKFKWVITAYEDGTKISYFERDVDVWPKDPHEEYFFTVGYDLEIFEAVIKLRKSYE